MKKCDIIVPIYNAHDCVIECVNSILKNTKFNGNHLILINDASPDERIKPLLENYAKKYKQIIHLENEQNLGFVGTVNRGMQYSKNDVLLLNSDTEVTENWLDKISDCAYSSDNIATVTPLSNNATLASVPNAFEPNDLPTGYTLEEMGKLVEKCSHNYYPEVPTGHGFCLFIKREVLDKVGYFDQESYGKGYGEENDFCFRCYEFGYRHVLCDNTYILHKESQSFLASKEALIIDGLNVLNKKYPMYRKRLDLWVQNKPIEYIGSNIALTIGSKEERPNILIIIHDWKTKVGGTTLHVMDLVKNLRNKFNFHIFTYENNVYKVHSYFRDVESVVKYPKISQNIKSLNYYNNDYNDLLSKIIDDYKISFVHIHQLINHYFDVHEVLTKKKIKYMITLHDFYCQCPLINKIYKEEVYCGNPSNEKCANCLNYAYNTKIDIQSWRKEWHKLLKGASYIITPSESTKQEMLSVYENIDITVIEHGIDIKKEKSTLQISDENNDIAFIGAIGVHKGSKILEKFITNNMFNNSKVHLFGLTSVKSCADDGHYINHGTYTRDELKKLLQDNGIKLICLFSIWPETYSYTMTEAIACGIPVISYDFGAIAERIKKYNLGWIIGRNATAEEIAKFIDNIFSNPREYNEVIDSINQYKVTSSKQMSKKYEKIYEKNCSLKGKIFYDPDLIKNMCQCYMKSITKSTEDIEILESTCNDLIAENEKLNDSLRKIYDAKGYRLLGNLYKIKNKVFHRKGE